MLKDLCGDSERFYENFLECSSEETKCREQTENMKQVNRTERRAE